ncbi:MAG TPA: 23S rRNA (adenine(2503)-C(2))-methyltransferase RlmN, partial [Erysipelotrichaceae bacterium]|nr:23S rRNA (adenine(2503)-C(2))-methyltransferase RlmN [Erysipelotrichaceae bacterium]
GEKKFRAQQVFEWIYRKDVYDFSKMTNLSKDLRAKLKATFASHYLDIVEKQVSKDGTTKYLLRLEDGGLIETVLMIHPYGKSLCVTSQLGCNMGCKFCASGLLKKQRNLTSGEMVNQVMTVSHDLKERISHVVIMGTGEPFDNYDNVMNFIYTINEPKGLAIGARHISVSTCGLIPGINKFANEGLQVNLAISLHAPNDEIRSRLMPINNTYNMDDLRVAISNYIDKTNRRVTLEYILLKGINDEVTHARMLAHYLRGLNVYVNLIPYNTVIENGLEKASDRKIQAFKDELIRLHINCTLRKEHGGDIDGACGQLRAKREGRMTDNEN